ncbi:MAG: TrmH family RNA methyltransferase [Candidatus Daviesbacteria bacterium]|nr:TrmH family RNA methyltransferase [Candidatus Daviesbacteria bacterium]
MKDTRKIILNAEQLRKLTGDKLQGTVKHKIKRNEIYIILDNVLDTYNIGSIFRLADAVAAKKIYLCGGSETPPNHRIKKASVNTMEVVEWEYCETALQAVSRVKREAERVKIVAIEQTATSVPYDKFEYKLPICLIVGHESDGVSPEVLKMCDAVVELPMFGINKSLNVMVSLGIVLYQVVNKLALRS